MLEGHTHSCYGVAGLQHVCPVARIIHPALDRPNQYGQFPLDWTQELVLSFIQNACASILHEPLPEPKCAVPSMALMKPVILRMCLVNVILRPDPSLSF